MCLTLKDGSKVEMRSVDNWVEIKKEIQQQIDARATNDNVQISLDDSPAGAEKSGKGA